MRDPDFTCLGVTTPGGRLMHWVMTSRRGDADPWIGTTVCGRTRLLTVDHLSLDVCTQCERALDKAAGR